MKPPVRWLEQPEDLPDDFLAGMGAYTEAGPSGEELAQMRRALHRRTGRPTIALKGLAGLALLAGIYALWPRPEAAPPVVPRSLAPPRVFVAAPEGSQPAPVVEAAAAPVVEAAPAPVVEAAPALARRSKRAPLSSRANDPAAELALLRRARRSLAVAPETSLALVAEHLRDYPHGVFAEERELIAIEALAQIDRSAAESRARSFSARYPHSVHAARIQVLLKAP